MSGRVFILPFEKTSLKDIPRVGGKNASLGEMIGALSKAGVRVPPGFSVTVAGYWHFLDENRLRAPIEALLKDLKAGRVSLKRAGAAIRALILAAPLPADLAAAISTAYAVLKKNAGSARLAVAVRSSATAEDLPEASFAGQHESFLNVRGGAALLDACRKCFASLFTDRAITYRDIHKLDHMKVALSVGVQQMVRADRAGAGVIFSIDTETGFPGVIVINAAWGLGEAVVKGAVSPDEYTVFKPLLGNPKLNPIIAKAAGAKARKVILAGGRGGGTRTVATAASERRGLVLTDDEILTLARWAVRVEDHYGRAMDMEWAKDGGDGRLYMLQARPETVQTRRAAGALTTFALKEKGKVLATGLSIGEAIAAGPVRIMKTLKGAETFPSGAVLVTAKTDPDWVPLMKRAGALVTERGGRTSHAAIVSRELGLPAIIGTGNATSVLKNGEEVTVSCAEGDRGFVYRGRLRFAATETVVGKLGATRTKVMLNLADPAAALRWWRLPADGIGLARMEFIITNHIKIHPMALVKFNLVKDRGARTAIARLTRGYRSKGDYFVDKLALGIGHLAASQYPRPVIVRLSDFKTDEYANLIGGRAFEPAEENPMIGWRGASRYYDPGYRAGFALECRALKRVREAMGFKNVIVMVPFCRTAQEADLVLAEMARNGLKRGAQGLQVYVMAEIPSNILCAEAFAERFDGFSIGSNDLTQLTLGVDRNAARLEKLFDARDPAVTQLIRDLVRRAHRAGATVGFCGQAPSDDPGYARLLVDAGIDSVSVTPDSFAPVKRNVAAAERPRKAKRTR